jgi:hypothetical protein
MRVLDPLDDHVGRPRVRPGARLLALQVIALLAVGDVIGANIARDAASSGAARSRRDSIFVCDARRSTPFLADAAERIAWIRSRASIAAGDARAIDL